MNRSNPNTLSIAYTYGLLPPRTKEELDLVAAQLRLVHRFRNEVVTLYLRYDRAYHAVVDRDPEVRHTLGQLESCETKIKHAEEETAAYHQIYKTADTPTELEEEITKCKRDKEKLYKQLAAARKTSAACSKKQIKQWRDTLYASLKIARQVANNEWGLASGSYNSILNTIQTAYSNHIENPGEHGLPKRRSFSIPQDGRIVVQTHHNVWGCLRGTSISDEGVYRTLRMYVGKVNGKYKFVNFPLYMHRPIPDGYTVKCIIVKATKVGPDLKYSCTLQLESPEGAVPTPTRPTQNFIGFDLGWRWLKNEEIKLRKGKTGIGEIRRVAYSVDDAGNKTDYAVGARVLGLVRRANELRGTIDSARNAYKNHIGELHKGGYFPKTWPDWALGRLRSAIHPKTKSPKHLTLLFGWWAANRFTGDEVEFEKLQRYEKHQRHLKQWEVRNRRKAANRRKNLYLEIGKQIAKTYSVVAFEDVDLRTLAKRKPIEHKSEELSGRTLRAAVAPGEFRAAVKQQCAKYGAKFVQVPAAGTSQVCPWCSHRNKWENNKAKEQTCSKCGETWDRDYIGAYNVLQRASE